MNVLSESTRQPLTRAMAIAVFVMTAVIYSGFDISATPLGLGIIKGWMMVVGFAGLALVLNSPLLRQRLTITPLMVWTYCVLAAMLLWTIVAKEPMNAANTIISFGWFAIMLFTSVVMFRTRAARLVAMRAIVLVVLGSVITNIVMAMAGTYRPSGLYGNPNTSGYALVMGMIATNNFVSPKYRFLYQLTVLAGVFTTASRGSLVLWGLALVLLHVFGRGPEKKYQNRWMIATLVILFGFAVSPFGSNLLSNVSDPSGDSRLTSLGSRENLEGDDRFFLMEMGFDHVVDHLFIGTGTGSAVIYFDNINYGPHNMYLAMMMQFGVLGILVIPGLALVLLGRPTARWQFSVPFAAFVMVASFFDHNMFEQWHYALMFALIWSLTGTETAPVPAKRAAEIEAAKPPYGYVLA